MNQMVVIYESKYGSTKRYAEWIAEALCCPLYERKHFSPQDFAKYDLILYGGGLYAGGVSGINLLTRHQDILSEKKIILFTVGLADPNNPENISHIRDGLKKVLSDELFSHTQFFHLRGGIDYSRLNLVHKAMMSMMRKMLLNKDTDSLSDEDKQLLDTYGKQVDFCDRESIQPLVRLSLTL